MSNIICPVCGIVNAVKEAPWNKDGFSSNEICPCCGTHYGEDDWAETPTGRNELHKKLREKWIEGGMKWWSNDPNSLKFKPENWNPVEQLKNIPKNA